jgi:hypothetical protein
MGLFIWFWIGVGFFCFIALYIIDKDVRTSERLLALCVLVISVLVPPLAMYALYNHYINRKSVTVKYK